MKIEILSKTLSDDSVVYDVRIDEMIIPAISRKDADEMASQIAWAINQFSTDNAEIIDKTTNQSLDQAWANASMT